MWTPLQRNRPTVVDTTLLGAVSVAASLYGHKRKRWLRTHSGSSRPVWRTRPSAALQVNANNAPQLRSLADDLSEAERARLFSVFPELSCHEPRVKLVYTDPPVLLLEDLLTPEECDAFIDSMMSRSSTLPRLLGQSGIPIPEWAGPIRAFCKGLPVLDWLGNPTVRWTYKARGLLQPLIERARKWTGLNIMAGAANIKHYREGDWLPEHIDYNRATLMVYLSDVDEGGETCFPTCGNLAVPPRRGSALIWPNQPPLPHAGERVVRGNKWILFYNWPAADNWEYTDNFEFNE